MQNPLSPPSMNALLRNKTSSPATSSPGSPLQNFSQISLGSPSSSSSLRSDERGLHLIHLLLNCATHASSGALDTLLPLLDHLSALSSTDGDAIQRVAARLAAALARRALRPWPGLHRSLCPPPARDESFLARQSFRDLCPFVKTASVMANRAIVEAMEGERVVHVVDLGGGDVDRPTQWLAFLRSMRNRPEGPPQLRITAVGEDKAVLDRVGMRLSAEAERFDVPFRFNGVVGRVEEIDVERLNVKSGEALAVNSILRLHCLLAVDSGGSPGGSPGAESHGLMSQSTLRELLQKETLFNRSSNLPPSRTMSSFLASIRRLSPKIMVVMEQESNHNAPTLTERFTEALNYYAALFDCLESMAPRESADRTRVEKVLLGEEINDIVAREGLERRERHERVDRWVQRMELARFSRVPISYVAMTQARKLLESCGRHEGYGVKEENGCSFICWQDRPLFSVSAWGCRR